MDKLVVSIALRLMFYFIYFINNSILRLGAGILESSWKVFHNATEFSLQKHVKLGTSMPWRYLPKNRFLLESL